MFFREKKSVREIVRLTSLSRNTLRKWLKAAVLEEPRYRRIEAPGKLRPFHESLKQALKVDAHRPRHERSCEPAGGRPDEPQTKARKQGVLTVVP